MMGFFESLLGYHSWGNMRLVEKAYINRIKSGVYYHNYRTYDLRNDDPVLLTGDFVPARFGANSMWYISNKDHENNKIKTDNVQGNIGHSHLMFPNGQFYDYDTKSKNTWTSEADMYPNIFKFLMNTHKLTALEKWGLISNLKESDEVNDPEYKLNFDEISKEIRRYYPEEFI